MFYRSVKFLLIDRSVADILPIGNTMKTQTTTQLGAVIRTRRKQLKITQKELAMTCGTGLRFIVDLEKGKPIKDFWKRRCTKMGARVCI